MREVQLFIKPEGSSDYQKVDLFQDEVISLTQTIRNSKDVSKVFTDFSRSFTVPASKTNNNIFKHFNRYEIDNGFDGRKRVDAKIEINRVPFKTGRIRLDGVQTKEDKAYAYKLTFFGNTIKLRDAIGEDKLGALEFPLSYNKTYNAAGIKAGLTADPTTEDVIVPLITHTQRLLYGDGSVDDIKADASVDHGVLWSELKYAIRVDAVVQAIAERYGFTFSDDSFFSSSNPNYYNLFLWLHRKKGDLQSDILETPSYSLFNLTSGTTSPSSFVWMRSDGAQIYVNDTRYLTGFALRIENTNGLTYSVSVRRDGEERLSRLNVTDSVLDLSLLGEAQVGAAYEVYISASPSDTLTVKWITTYQEPFNPAETLEFSGTQTVGDDPSFNITEQIPEMKVMDFLSGLFKMFNLVAEIDDQNVVTVKTLNDYYSQGVPRDITQYIDNTTGDVDVAIQYSEIEYKYKSTETILADQYNQIKNKEWGADSYNTEDNLKEGEKFIVEIPFEHMQFERLNDISTGSATNVMYGYYVDDNLDPYIGAPLVFYAVSNSVSTSPISFVTSTDTDGNFDARDTINTSIVVPSNSLTLDGASEVRDNLHFYLEGNEYSPNVEFYKTLFYNYHFNYIASLFNFRNRMSKFKAVLPMNILINYSLADTLIIQGNRYRINSINTNLNTGESHLELLNIIPAYALAGAGEAGGDEGTGTGGGGGEVDTLFAAISGERNPTEGTSHVYTSTVTGTATGTIAYQWSVSSGGTIVGSSTNANVEISWAEVSQDSTRTISLTVTRNNDGSPVSFTTDPYQVTVEDGTPAPTPLSIDILQSGGTPDDAVAEGALRIYDAALYGDYDTPVTYTWSADGGTITSGQGTSRVNVTWNEIPGDTGNDYNGSITLTVSSNDGQTPAPKSYPVRVVDGTTAPYINITMTNVSPSVELGYTTTYGSIIDSNITTSNPDIYSWSITGGVINSGQFSDSANVTWDTPGEGSISVSVTREGESDTDTNIIDVVEYYTTAEITGDFSAVAEGTTRSYGSTIGGNTSGDVTYTWSASKGEISGGSYDGNGNSVLSGVGISGVDVTWGLYELGTGTLSLSATRQGYTGVAPTQSISIGIYYLFTACDGGETVVSTQSSAAPQYDPVNGGQAYVDYSGASPVYYTYADSFVYSPTGYTEKQLQAYSPLTFGCPTPPPPPENVIDISGPSVAPTEGQSGVDYTITTDPQTVGWSASAVPLDPAFNEVPITITSATGGTGDGTLTVTFGAYNGNGTETLYSQIRIDDDSSDVYAAVTVSQSPPPPTTYYVFTACDPVNWSDVMIEAASEPATNQRAVGGSDNYYTYSGTTTTDENAYSIATLTLEATTGCPEPSACTRYQALNEGSSVTYFIYVDCTSGGSRLLDVSPGQARDVCAQNGTFEYTSGDTNYTITELGDC